MRIKIADKIWNFIYFFVSFLTHILREVLENIGDSDTECNLKIPHANPIDGWTPL